MTRSGIHNLLNYCVIFIVYTQFTNVSAGCIIQDGGPRAGDPWCTLYGIHFPLFIIYLFDVPEESLQVHLITWFYVIFYFRQWGVIAVINSVKNSLKTCSPQHVAIQSNRNRNSDATVSCMVLNNDDVVSAKGSSTAKQVGTVLVVKTRGRDSVGALRNNLV
jgi:hypothetical protein